MKIFENRNCLYTTTINISREENNSEIKIGSKQGHPIFKGSESATWVCVSVPWGPFLHCTDAAALPILLENFDIYLMYTYTAHPPKLMIKIYVLYLAILHLPTPNKITEVLSPYRPVPHLISDDSQVQSRYLHMKRKILQFQFVWPMEGGHLRRELCFCMKMFTNVVDDPISFLS